MSREFPSKAALFRLHGITAHFRDPRYHTGDAGNLFLRTLRCPPPSMIHGLLCAAAGRWVEPSTLRLGWQMEYASVDDDFQTCQIRKQESTKHSDTNEQPRTREFLSFPVLSILALQGIDIEWFRAPANPLSLGRSEDMVIHTEMNRECNIRACDQGRIQNQCLPIGIAFGTLYTSPLFWDERRRPYGMSPRTDASTAQDVRTNSLVTAEGIDTNFYIWEFGNVAG